MADSPEKTKIRQRKAAKRTEAYRERVEHRRDLRYSGAYGSAKNLPEQQAALGTRTCISPEILDFQSYPESAAEFFNQLRRAVRQRHCRILLVDHTPLKEVTPASALVLIAEMYRLNTMFPHVQLKIRAPSSTSSHQVLGQIGYYDYADELEWTPHESKGKGFWKHKRGEGVMQRLAKDLIDYLPSYGRISTQLLFEALVECMQNASEHGYSPNEKGYRSWWLMGYKDRETHELAFCFYDQGAGIPQTIRTRWKDRLPFIRPPGSELIKQAVIQGRYSKTKTKTRGRGLPRLKRFIDDADRGEMLIFSKESHVVFRHGQEPVCADYNIPLHGTLISWNIAIDGN